MPFCPNCGTEVAEGVSFCPTCGTKISASIPLTPQKARPSKLIQFITGVTVISILEVISGILFIFGGIDVLAIGGLIEATIPLFVGGALVSAGMLIIGIGIISFILAYGLWKRRNWAWSTTMIFSVLGLIHNILLLPSGLIGLIINAVTLFYLTRPKIKALFRPSP
ncbi:MAG: zinc-ribbon domain-containing protein [Thaumarchaeota archaeon]|nr:zinc-ribbon domain-containing protein [Nitrososphaerota archaeon]